MAALSAELVILGIREALSTCCGPSWGQRMKYNFWLLGCEDCAHTGVMGKRLNVACTVRGLLSGGFRGKTWLLKLKQGFHMELIHGGFYTFGPRDSCVIWMLKILCISEWVTAQKSM